jgi:C1A family cysteine protease
MPKTIPRSLSAFFAFQANVMSAYALNEEQGVHCTDFFDGADCVFGITKFSDMFQDEFAKTSLGYKPSKEIANATVLNLEELLSDAPTSVDWRTKGAVSPVKDQNACGSCWAFSATEEIESQMFMKSGKLPILSTQQLVACDMVDLGCDGGNTENAYAYVKKAGGLDTARDYPDTSSSSGDTGRCKWDKKEVAKITGFTYATKPCNDGPCKHQDEDALAAALVAKGPISICVNAGSDAWQSYQKGVFSKKCSADASLIDHCVQLVGFDKSGPTPYWIVRNSWNTDWGMDGYMHLAMGHNLCGIANDATIADVAADASIIV